MPGKSHSLTEIQRKEKQQKFMSYMFEATEHMPLVWGHGLRLSVLKLIKTGSCKWQQSHLMYTFHVHIPFYALLCRRAKETGL